MSLVLEQARDYFASLNPLAKKIFQEFDVLKQSRGESWEKLTEEEQDETIDRYFVDDSIREKYEDTAQEDYPSSFPQLKVATGEKIVVDFDKDSQQELSLFDDDPDEGLGNDNSGAGTSKKPKKPPRKSRSPERDSNLAFKPERSIWESPFLAADRGLDGGYHSSLTSDQSKSSEDSDDILHKFGISLSLGGSTNLDFDEDMKLLDNFDIEEPKPNSQTDTDSVFTTNTDSPEVTHRSRKQEELLVEDRAEDVAAHPAEISREDDILMQMKHDVDDRDRGHVSPVYIEDPGESSDSVDNFTFHKDEDNFHYEEEEEASRLSGNVNDALDAETKRDDLQVGDDPFTDWKPNILSLSNGDSQTELTKTGFDFLDNW